MKILNLEPDGYSPKARALLETAGTVDDGPLSREDLKNKISAYDILIVRLGHLIDAEILEKANSLKVIVTATTGLNHIDLETATQRGIAVLSLKGETEFLGGIPATAEHTMALILALARRVPFAFCDVCEGEWNRDAFRGIELQGRTLGIVGYGRLGSKVARMAQGFGMQILAHDIRPVEGVELCDFKALLAGADIVSLHADFSEKNRALFGAAQFSAMKKGAFFINTARGEMVDEGALLSALQAGHLAGAAVDVLQGEYSGREKWAEQDPLIRYARDHDTLIVTPHIGGATIDSMRKTEIFMAEKLLRFLKSESA